MRTFMTFHFSLLTAMMVLCCINHTMAQDKSASFIVSSAKAVRLLGANCFPDGCFLSEAFAPKIETDKQAAVTVTNNGTQDLSITPTFVPTNGPAIGVGGSGVLAPFDTLQLKPGETGSLKLSITADGLSAGTYSGELMLTAPNTARIILPLEIHVRTSVVWAILAALCGIILGRLSQLVYDPKVVARVRLYDWLFELEEGLETVADQNVKASLRNKLSALRQQLAARNADADTLASQIAALATEIQQALQATAAAAGAAASVPNIRTNRPEIALRWLAGVTPLPIDTVYARLMPALVLITLAALTIVFVLQQYGGSGTAETFGAGGLADYASLFLAGVASEAITNGLRAVKFTAS
ncbi:hypothetical protein [Rhizobium johnstonii]|uniref:hypothetical protein n=1 Tax=Rhizobium johnstonii TaxID=3019933 RepID=UPI003F9567C7